jgi:predicted ester cyclase
LVQNQPGWRRGVNQLAAQACQAPADAVALVPAGGDAVRAFAEKFRAAFPDLNFRGTAGLIAEGDYVVGQWEGGGTHTGGEFDDMPFGPLPAGTGKTMRFTGTTVLKVENGLITQEIGLDDGVTALTQLGLITKA